MKEDLAHKIALINKVLIYGFEETIKNRFDEDFYWLLEIKDDDYIRIKNNLTSKLLALSNTPHK